MALPGPGSLSPAFHLPLVSGGCHDQLPTLGGFVRHACPVLQFWGPEVQMQGVGRAVLPGEAPGKILPTPSSCWRLPLGLRPHHCNLGCVAFSPLGLPVCHRRTVVTGLAPPPDYPG